MVKNLFGLILILSISNYSCNKVVADSKSEPLTLKLNPTNVSIYGGDDGSIDLTVTGGFTPYNYIWSNGETSEDISDLSVGTYTVNVTDNNSITLQDSAIITEPSLSIFDYDRLNEKTVIVEENIYGGVNVTIFSGDEGNLIIDSGAESLESVLDSTIQVLNPNGLKYIINTHNHIDHLGGNSILPAGGSMIGHDYGRYDFIPTSTNPNFIGITNEYSFTFNDEEIKCFPMTQWGHTNTDIAIYFEDLKILCLGDTYLSESFPSVASSRGARVQNAIINYEFILNNFPSDITIIPGHGHASTTDELRSYLNMVNETVNIVRSQMIDGASLNDIIASNALSDYDQWGQALAADGLTTEFWIMAIYGSY